MGLYQSLNTVLVFLSAKLAVPFEGYETISIAQQKLRRSYYVYLGLLPNKVRRCAYQQSVAKMKHIAQLTKEYFSQLQETLDLVCMQYIGHQD